MAYNFKCVYAEWPSFVLGVLFLGTIFIFAYVVRIIEMPYFRAQGLPGKFDSYFTSIYFTVITLTTIGYGDISPGTTYG